MDEWSLVYREAKALVLLGDLDGAIDALNELMTLPRPVVSIHTLRLDPTWDPLRDHPRFKALVADPDAT